MAEALTKFAPFERTETLGARVRERLRSSIMAGHFRPGDKLTLRALASSLGVSLTPAREALFNLAAEGVLEMRANGSVYIPEMDAVDFRELTKTRMALEGLAALEATAKIDSETVEEIASINDQLVQADQRADYPRLIDLNWSFHFKIYAASQMPFTLRLIESCWLRSGSYVNLIYPDFAKTNQGISNHSAIIRALRDRDSEGVAASIRADIEFASRAYLELLDS